jgi:large subunit ribosomal protein L13
MKTFSAKAGTVKQEWIVVDAAGKVLGRLAAEIARRLRGKHKPEFTPHVDTGDYIVVVNVDKLRVTGRKAQNKIYYRHSTYPGGIYSTSFEKLHARHPDRVLKLAVKGMLPKGPLGYALLKKMKMYTGANHPHAAQQPRQLEI